jgi:hypothetical protein
MRCRWTPYGQEALHLRVFEVMFPETPVSPRTRHVESSEVEAVLVKALDLEANGWHHVGSLHI